jgi:hypothetical protein
VNPGSPLGVIGRTGHIGGEALPTYRLYRLDGAGRISAAEWIEAAGDDEARSIARQGAESPRYELWHRSRFVDRVIDGEK